MPYIPFTEEQKIAANSVDLADFLRLRGEKLESAGREHKLVYYDGSGKHDSITINGSFLIVSIGNPNSTSDNPNSVVTPNS